MEMFGADHGLAPVDELPSDPALAELAGRVPGHVRFGTTSWTFRGWQDIVYRRRYASDKQFVRFSLGEYARWPLFRTVGIDRSFYQPLAAEELGEYAAQLPAGFPCCMKMWSELTTLVFPDHPRYGDRAGRLNERFLDVDIFRAAIAQPLRAAFADHAGPQLLEISPMPRVPDTAVFYDRLRAFLAAAPTDLRFAVELRERRLFTPRYLAILREHGAAHVFNYWSRMPDIGAQLAVDGTFTAPFAVARLMLPPGRSYEQMRDAYEPFDRLVEPQPAMRRDVVALARAAGERGVELFVLANNKAEGSSPLTVRALAELLASNEA